MFFAIGVKEVGDGGKVVSTVVEDGGFCVDSSFCWVV